MENYISYKEFKKKALKNKEVKKAYDALGPEYALIAKIIERRIKDGLTQKELAKRAKTKQPVISRFERGDFNPSLQFLFKMAKALDLKLKISIS